MQPAAQSSCDTTTHYERLSKEGVTPIADGKTTVRVRRRISDVLDWLDSHWDDPELRSGFWRSGW